MLRQIAQHKTALGVYVFYFILWIWLGFIAYNDFSNHGDGETIGINLFARKILNRLAKSATNQPCDKHTIRLALIAF
jgi:hypothetical protein